MRCLILLAALVGLCAAQEPKPCMSPSQWEGRVITTDRTKEFFEYARITYDETNKRFRIIEERDMGSEKDYYDTLYLHNIGREYRLNLKTRQCNTTSLMRPFRPFGIPPFAKFLYEAEIGATGVPGESLIAQVFEGEYEDGSKFETTVTFPDCVPIHHAYYSNDTGLVIRDFFDQNLGISDPSVFIPPRECTM